MNRTTVYATTTGIPVRQRPCAGAREQTKSPAPAVRDLRDRPGGGPRTLRFGPRDLAVVTGLPGSGKSTLMRRTVPGRRVDSQD
ncbi:ATP-binding protein, partial [Streptomyces sp. SID2999]|nr:ATP-binding protein [Streptomyces sp. SID2999]